MVLPVKPNVIKDIGSEYKLITDSQEVAELSRMLGITDLQGCSGVFVKLSDKGDSIEAVYGFEGIVPKLNKPVIQLKGIEHGS